MNMYVTVVSKPIKTKNNWRHNARWYILQNQRTAFICALVHFSFTGDYDDEIFVKTIPPSTTSRVLSQDILIENDNVNEIVQRFALVGELGPEIPDSFACFRVTFGEAECRGRVGAIGIRIGDNDR